MGVGRGLGVSAPENQGNVDIRAGPAQPELEETVHSSYRLVKGRCWSLFEQDRG